ncbi:MAG: ABC transporter substrate-binding protein [Hyphomicrobiaceae bacterium]
MQTASSFVMALLVSVLSANVAAERAIGDVRNSQDHTRRETGALHVVAAVPMTGRYAATGDAVARRLTQTVADLNGAGGVIGRPVELTVIDDACSREGGAAAAQAAAQIAAAVVVGHPCPSAAEAALHAYGGSGQLVLLAGLRHPGVKPAAHGPLVFRISGSDDRLGGDAGRRLARLAGPGAPIAIVHDRTVLSKSIAAEALTAAAEAGAGPPTQIGIVASEASYAKDAATLIAAAPAAILFCGYPAEGAILLRELRTRGAVVPFLVTDTHLSAEFIADAGALLDGPAEVMAPSPAGGSGTAQEDFAGIVAADAQTAVTAWRNAIEIAGSAVPTAVAHQLAHRSAAVLGIAFDDAHQIAAPSFRAYRWRDGGWRLAPD